MKRIKTIVFVLAVMVLLLTGCGAKEEAAVTGIKFNRGHGSMWGNQFYMELQATQIVCVRYIPEGRSEPVTLEHIPITDAQWQAIKNALEQLPLEKARPAAWGKNRLDGSEFRELTLIRGEKETKYKWPNTPEANQLEKLLEALLKNSVQPQAYDTGQFRAAIPASLVSSDAP